MGVTHTLRIWKAEAVWERNGTDRHRRVLMHLCLTDTEHEALTVCGHVIQLTEWHMGEKLSWCSTCDINSHLGWIESSKAPKEDVTAWWDGQVYKENQDPLEDEDDEPEDYDDYGEEDEDA